MRSNRILHKFNLFNAPDNAFRAAASVEAQSIRAKRNRVLHVDKRGIAQCQKTLSTCGKVISNRLWEHFYTKTGDIRGITGISLLGFCGFRRLEKVVHSGERRNRDTPTQEGKR